MAPRQQRQGGQAEVAPEQHAEPPSGEAHDRGEILDLAGPEQSGNTRAEQHAEQHVLGPADVAVAIAQPIEQHVGEDVPDGDDGERGQRGLHRGDTSRCERLMLARCGAPG
jgi:hypothetical protein